MDKKLPEVGEIWVETEETLDEGETAWDIEITEVDDSITTYAFVNGGESEGLINDTFFEYFEFKYNPLIVAKIEKQFQEMRKIF